jgi:hypothetical protein
VDRQFIQERIDATKAAIAAVEAARLALAVGGAQSYTIDTGQSRQVVTKMNLTEIRKTISSLYNECATLEARLTGGGVSNVRP